MYRNTANIISCTRILFGIGILFFPALSDGFFVLLVLGGLTDIVDGYIARRTDTDSVIGSKVDSAADMIFIALMLVKLLPSLDIPLWIWIWICFVILVKAINIICGYKLYGKFISGHTVLYKITGLLLFAFPFSLLWLDLIYGSTFVLAFATLAAVQEGHYIRTGVIYE